jgi:periplasmic copper chaperone A
LVCHLPLVRLPSEQLHVIGQLGQHSRQIRTIIMSFTRRAALLAASATILLAFIAPPSQAHGFKIGDLEIGHPWTRATPPSARVAGGFFTITNTGALPDRLISASFAGSTTVELHEMAHEGGVMTMRELPAGMEIKPGARLELRPGGLHLMFMGLKDALKETDSIKGELVFERAGRVEVSFKVESMGYRPKAAGADHDHAGHGAKTQ